MKIIYLIINTYEWNLLRFKSKKKQNVFSIYNLIETRKNTHKSHFILKIKRQHHLRFIGAISKLISIEIPYKFRSEFIDIILR